MKRVLITGAADGIGAGAAAFLRQRGHPVAGLDLNAPNEELIEADVSDQESVDAGVAEAVNRLGGLDAVVNNAGVGHVQDSGKPPEEDTEALLQVNLLGAWRVTGAAMPHLLESHDARVVNVASGLAHLTPPYSAAYCASKRGIVAYSDALRTEYRGRVSVTTVYPGYIRTAIHEGPSEKGIGLEGVVPAEPLESAAAAITRAVLGPPRRDLATTRRGTASYALLRLMPPAVVDRLIELAVRRMVSTRDMRESELGGPLAERLARR